MIPLPARLLVALGAGALGACSTGALPAAEAPVRAKPTDYLEGLEPEIYKPESTTTTEPATETTTIMFVAGANEEQIAGTFDTPVEVPENSVARSTVIEPVDEWAIPTAIVMCESGGDWNAYNESSGAAGPYQLLPEHTNGNDARNLSADKQHAIAAELWNDGFGASNWSECL